MKKIRIFGVLLSLCLVAALVFNSCAPEEAPPPAPPAPPPAAPPAAPPAPPPAEPKIEARSWSYAAPTARNEESWDLSMLPFSEELGRLTDGAITMEPYWSSSLVGWMDMADGISMGLTDFGYLPTGSFPSLFPTGMLPGVMDIALSEKQDLETWAYLSDIIAHEFVQAELNRHGIKYLFVPGTVYEALFTSMPISRLADLDGLKLRMWGGKYQAKFYEAAGAVGVPMPFPEYYEAVQRGIVQGVVTIIITVYEAKQYEVSPYMLCTDERGFMHLSVLNGGFYPAMNLNLWNSLPDNLKLMMLESAKYAQEVTVEGMPKADDEYIAKLKAEGAIISILPPEDVETWMAHPLVSNQWEELAQDIDELGGKGTEYVARFLELTDMSKAEIMAIWEQMWADRLANLR